jgi:hypothetical protein
VELRRLLRARLGVGRLRFGFGYERVLYDGRLVEAIRGYLDSHILFYRLLLLQSSVKEV